MAWEIEFIKLLQEGSGKFGDYLFYILTQLGTETFFMLAAMLLYWCLDKREGYKLVTLFMVSQLFVGFIKVLVRRPRPYTVEGIRPIMQQTDGYSFPSGHSNNIAVISTHLTIYAKRRYNALAYAVIVACFVTVLVMLSRLYLGQHYPTDVITGVLIGIGVGIVGNFVFDKFKGGEEKIAYIVVPVCAILIIAAVVFYLIKGEVLDSVPKIAGTFSAFSIGYYIEKRRVGYEIKSEKKRNYVIRFILGAAVVVAVNFGLKALFKLFVSGIWMLIVDFAICFFVGIWVALLAPMLFKKLKI